MIYSAYFDESGTHSDAVMSVVAGFVANARQWRKYDKRTSQLFARYGVNVFHAIDVRRGHGDFKGWTVDRKIEFLDEFQHIINDTLENGVSAFIRSDDYKYHRGLYWPAKARPDSKYTIMVRACLSHVIDIVGHIPQDIEPRLHIVLEDGHNNAEDAVRSYKWVQDRLGPRRALSGLAFANKDCLPLAAADMFAYTSLGDKLGQKPIGTPKKSPKSESSYRGNMYWIDLNRDSLDGLYQQAIDLINGRLSQVPHVLRRQPS